MRLEMKWGRGSHCLQMEGSDLHDEDHREPLEKHSGWGVSGGICALSQISLGPRAAGDRPGQGEHWWSHFGKRKDEDLHQGMGERDAEIGNRRDFVKRL